MNTESLLAAHRAHVAAHGRDCGRGSGKSERDPCVALYRAWLHMSTGEWHLKHPLEHRLYMAERYRRVGPPYRAGGPDADGAARQRERYWSDPEKYRARNSEWKRQHPDAANAQSRRYYERHKEDMNRKRVERRRVERMRATEVATG